MGNKRFNVLYGYVNGFDKFITVQALHNISGDKTDQLLQEWSRQIGIGVEAGYVQKLLVNVNPETYVIESPLYLSFKTRDTGYRLFEVWVVDTSVEDIFSFIERSPSADNVPDLDMNLLPLFGMPMESYAPAPLSRRFALTGSNRCTIIRDANTLPKNYN